VTRRIAAVAVSAALVLAGCAASGPTRAEFDTKANGVCAGYNFQEKALGPVDSSDTKALAAYLGEVAALGQAESSDLMKLRTPKRDRAAFERVLLAEQGEVTQAQQLAATLKAGDYTMAQKQLGALRAQNESANLQFDALGLTACGSDAGG
jgi:hypothetical protein